MSGRASGGEQARPEDGAGNSFAEQGLLFPDDRPMPDADAGYRGQPPFARSRPKLLGRGDTE